jgi:DNA-binding NarL/FixJ family response regulator
LRVTRARIAIIDDQPLFRHGLRHVLERALAVDVVVEAGDGRAALDTLRSARVDLAILDVLLPSLSGLTLSSELHEIQPLCRVLVLSDVDEPGIIVDMFRAHACGYVHKMQPVEQVVDAAGRVLRGRRYLPPTMSPEVVEAALETTGRSLTRRERDVFELLIRGFTLSQIAGHLRISRRTAEVHHQHIVNKLSPRAITELQRFRAMAGG